MVDLNLPLLKQICLLPGAPGHEAPIRQLVADTVRPFVDEMRIDNMGNLITLKKGKSNKKVLIAAHLDEISFIITHIDKDGYGRFHTLGGFDPKTLTAQRVIVHGKKDLIGVMGSKPIHLMKDEDRSKAPKITDYFIDFGLPREEVAKFIKVGDPVTRQRDLIELGDCVSSKSLDNRLSVFILIETLRQLEDPPYDVYGVFTVQEEVGLRGATTAAAQIDPDFGFGLDVTIANDVPGAAGHEKITSLGHGAAIKIMDASVISDTRMVRFMQEVADANKLPWQPEILTRGGTDTAALQRAGNSGAIVGCISIPTRHVHSVVETAHKKDISAAISLLRHCLSGMDRFSYEW